MKNATAVAALLSATLFAAPAFAHEVKYFATLTGDAESPPNASSGVGSALVTIDFDLATMKIDATFSGLTGNVTAAHIHCCTATQNAGTAGVASPVPSFPGFPTGVTSGSYTQTFDLTLASSYNPAFVVANGGSVGSAMNALFSGLDSNRAYLNIHTSTSPGGEIRGFLAPVPEPETCGMLLAGLGLTGWAARRGSRRAA